LSVRPFHHSPAAAAGLLLSAAPTGDIDQQRQPPGARSAANASRVTFTAAADVEKTNTNLLSEKKTAVGAFIR